jgi:nonsense-mediated mRNA decay protein 3
VLISLTLPCYLCGAAAVIDGLCASCYDKDHPLIEVSSPVTILSCKRCGSVKVPGGWKKISADDLDSEELAILQMEIVLQNEIKILREGVTLALEEVKKLDRVSHIVVIASGQSHEKLPPHDEEYPVEIRFSYGTCETCGKMSGGYYEAILQIRADSRQLTDVEKELLTQKVKDMTVARYKTDDKAFITTVTDDKYGLDFYIGSEHLCKYIADELETQYLAERKENYSLVGEDKAGNKKYRITILIKLPRFSVGDFISLDNEPCQILDMGRNTITCFGLKRRERFTLNPKSSRWRTLEYLAPKSVRRAYMIVTYAQNQPVTLMDSQSYETVEVDESRFDFEIETGSTAHGVVFEDTLYILPNQIEIDNNY